MRHSVVFDRKRGLLGMKRTANKNEEKEFGANYVVDVLDPISFKKSKTVVHIGPDYDWHTLPREDPRVQFIKLFDVIASANWDYSGYSEDDGIVVEEAFIENEHEVFEQVREIFANKL